MFKRAFLLLPMIWLCAFSPAQSPVKSPVNSAVVNVDAAEEDAPITYLDSATADVVFQIDATKAASYTSGQTWTNVTAAPDEGSAQTAYDFFLGNDNTETTDDPTFTGTAGSSSAYFSYDGGDLNEIAGGNTTFINNLHKTTGGADFTLVYVGRLIASASTQVLFSTQPNSLTGNHGLSLFIAGNVSGGEIRLRQRGTGTSDALSGVSISDGTDYVIIVSHSHSGNNTRFWINTTTKTDVAHTFNTTTNNAGGVATFNATNSGTAVSLMPASGTRMYAAAMINAYIDDAQAAQIFSYFETAHARDYTP